MHQSPRCQGYAIDQRTLRHLCVRRPGQAVGAVTGDASSWLGIPEGCLVHAGTTDSIAAFVAAGVSEVGEAVTSLGSTLAVKLLSEEPVEDAAFGVYSHRLGDAWLVGGASNVGGAVVSRIFVTGRARRVGALADPRTGLKADQALLPESQCPVLCCRSGLLSIRGL